MKKYKVASLFAGIGGIDLAFQGVGFDIIWANEIDKYACQTYRVNFPSHRLVEGDIKQIKTEDVPNFDILIAGFPCQAFSVAGEQKGFNDERGKLFFEIIRFLKDKKPLAFLLENVRNLVNHNKGETLKKVLELLKSCGYSVKCDVLSADTHGNIPQNRERIFIVGFLKKEQCESFSFPLEVSLKTQIKDLVDFKEMQKANYYYSANNHGYYEKLNQEINKENTVYQWRRVYVRENKSGVCPTLTANLGTGGHNVPLVFTKWGIRKLTPRECFNLQGFPLTFKLPNLANCHLYKQAGNSVVVPLIKRVAENILVSLKELGKEKLGKITIQKSPILPLGEQA
jgi:DNA (cytosine-5)-methyltransferase 1